MVKLKKHNLIVLFISAFAVTGCTDNYEESHRLVNVEPFSQIQLNSVFSVVLKQGTDYAVEIIADEDIIQDIQVTVVDARLDLTDNSTFKWMSPERTAIKVIITAPGFSAFTAKQSYSLTNINRLEVSELYIINEAEVKLSDVALNVSGGNIIYWNNWLAGGKLVIEGELEYFEAHNYALHSIEAKNLIAREAVLHNYGRESCTVNVSDHFEYSIMGPGDIILYGNPADVVLLDKKSTGKLIRAD